MSPLGSDLLHGLVPDVLFPRTPAPSTQHIGTDRFLEGEMTDRVREQIARTLREFGFFPKGLARTYQKSYPEYYDNIPYPLGV
jgi:hypothetical protein